MFSALKIFQDKAPKNMDVIRNGTFEISSLLYNNPVGRTNMAERLLYSQMFNKKMMLNKLKKVKHNSPSKANEPTSKPTNKPTNTKTLQKNSNKVIAPLLG